MARYDDRYDGYDRYGGNTKLYVGRLSTSTRMQDLEHLFSRYGRVRHVDLKYDYGFVEFSDPRDADDARYELDGREFDGSRLIVEFAKGTLRGPGSSRDYMGRGPSPGSGRCFNCGIDGHWARDCNAGDLKNKCYRCGERGHIERNCQNSAKNLKRGRSYSRSPPPHHGRNRSKSYSRDHSRSHSPRRGDRGAGHEERLTPRRDGRGAGHEERQSRSPGYSRSSRSASPSQGRNRSRTPNVMSLPPRERAEHNGSYRSGSHRIGESRSPSSDRCPAASGRSPSPREC